MSSYELFQDTNSRRETYKYSQVLDPDQIRILEIQSDLPTTVLRCRLVTAQRKSIEPYKALSYVWGSSSPDSSILVDGKTFWIRKNLNDALHRVRKTDQVVRLWVDAICINQEDETERNSQVMQMGETYNQAEEVLIWLGNGHHHSVRLSTMCDLAKAMPDVPSADIVAKAPQIGEFFANPWFGRLWVVQEVLLAKDATVLLGVEECDLDALFSLANAVQKIFYMFDPEGENFKAASDNLLLFHTMMGLRCHPWMQMKDGRTIDINDGRYLDFRLLVLNGLDRACQDPRDYIFGMVGIGRIIGLETQVVDYSLSYMDVFQAFSRRMLMQTSESLVDFDPGLRGYDPDLGTKMPSWVLDPSKPSIADPFVFDFYCCGGPDMQPHLFKDAFAIGEGLMELSGLEFDVIHKHEFCEGSPNNDPALGAVALFGHTAEALLTSRQHNSSPYGDWDGQVEACWRTIIGNAYREYTRQDGRATHIDIATSDESRFYEFVMKRGSYSVEDIRAEFERYTSFLLSCVAFGRAIFVTSQGYLGLGPKGTAAGDIVVVLPGFEMPVILRKQLQSDCHRLVGVAYVHGIMKGEYIEQVSHTPERHPRTYIIE